MAAAVLALVVVGAGAANSLEAPPHDFATYLKRTAEAEAVLGAMPGADPGHANERFYASWSMDRDGNGLDDRIDDQLRAVSDENVHLVLHYARAPTQADAQAMREVYGIQQSYVFRNFDMVQLVAPLDLAPALLDLSGVVAVELFEPPIPDLSVSAPAIRARAATDVPVVNDVDHALAVHETFGLRGEGIVIAVVDTGVDTRHESLQGKLVQKPGPGGKPLLGGVYTGALVPVECIDPLDFLFHGTHVAGIALGTGGPTDVHRGVAPAARLVDVNIAVPGGVGTGMLLGFDWIISFNKGETCYKDPGEDRVDIVNISFSAGGNSPDNVEARAMNRLAREGVVVVASAGNDGPAEGSLNKGPDGAIFVANAATNGTVVRDDDAIARLSSRGPRTPDDDADTLDELRPDVAAPGTLIHAAMVHLATEYWAWSGTSMATPHIAGVAALMLQANPDLRPFDREGAAIGDEGSVPLRDVLQRTAQYGTDTGSAPSPQHEQPGKFGLPWNNAWGYGLVDAYRAVLLAENTLALHAGGPYTLTQPGSVDLEPVIRAGTPPLQHDWDVLAVPEGSTLSAWTSNLEAPPFAPDVTGDYRIRLQATDADGRYGVASVMLEYDLGE